MATHQHLTFYFQCGLSDDVAGHARMRVPAGRASMWRDGYPTLEDYNDDECFCGGYTVCHNLELQAMNDYLLE